MEILLLPVFYCQMNILYLDKFEPLEFTVLTVRFSAAFKALVRAQMQDLQDIVSREK